MPWNTFNLNRSVEILNCFILHQDSCTLLRSFDSFFSNFSFCFCLSLFFDWAISNGKTSFPEHIKKFFFIHHQLSSIVRPPLCFYWSNKRSKQVNHGICWQTGSETSNTILSSLYVHPLLRLCSSFYHWEHKISFSIRLFYPFQMNSCE